MQISFSSAEENNASGQDKDRKKKRELEKICGAKLCRKIYSSPDSSYAVLAFLAQNLMITATFQLLEDFPKPEQPYTLYGEWKDNKKYGRQFETYYLEPEFENNSQGLLAFLGGGFVKGIGPGVASKLVKHFGDSAMNILDQHPERLTEVPGIGPKKAKMISEGWESQRLFRNVMIELAGFGLTSSMIAKICKMYGAKAAEQVKSNPYELCNIDGIGFKKADKIADLIGFPVIIPFRCRKALTYTLRDKAEGTGHVCYNPEVLVSETCKMLEESRPSGDRIELIKMLRSEIKGLVGDGEFVFQAEPRMVYLRDLWFAECGTAGNLKRIMEAEPKSKCRVYPPEKNVYYDEEQITAIKVSCDKNVLVITGGPGRGKSFLLREIIRQFRLNGLAVLLAAPTGKAAKRMEETTGMQAKTIHRLLDYGPNADGVLCFRKNEDKPLVGDALIIDEASMIDIRLMNSLLKAIPDGMRLIIVGDADQLPSVGPGNVLNDIINSGAVTTVRLVKLHRQKEDSRIALNAGRINDGEMPVANSESDFVIKETLPDSAAQEISKLIVEECFKKHGFTLDDIQILCPLKKGPSGTYALNSMMQNLFNAGGNVIRRLSSDGCVVELREGDRVIQTENDYEREVFNGDSGILLMTEDGPAVKFSDGKVIKYSKDDLSSLQPAYALTIHKSQGSEYPCTIITCDTGAWIMLRRNLLYTGVTRAKKQVYLVGQLKAISKAVKTKDTFVRNSCLINRLSGLKG